MLADGAFLIIDQNSVVVHIDAPQDAAIMKLNEALNKTYIAYGSRGWHKKENQSIQDNNANGKSASGASIQRVITKSSSNYCNTGWDLVDAAKSKLFDVSKIKVGELPVNMRKMTNEQRMEYISTMAKKRAKIQNEILELNKKRIIYVTKIRKELAKQSNKQTLDEVITNTIRNQAKRKGYNFGK